ncbi:MAG: Crp/Fnr family transcriptional regulator [Alphaproteobacteria bacterium]
MNPLVALLARLGPPQTRRCQPGEVIFRAGDAVANLYLVEKGQARLVRTLADGAAVTLAVAGAGEIVAEASLFASTYHCDAQCDAPTVLQVFRKAKAHRTLAQDGAAAMALNAHLSRVVQGLRGQIALLGIRAARERVLAFIEMNMPADGAPLHLSTSWKTLATRLGLTHETVYRALAQLEKDRVIQRSGRTIGLTAPGIVAGSAPAA